MHYLEVSRTGVQLGLGLTLPIKIRLARKKIGLQAFLTSQFLRLMNKLFGFFQ